MHLDVPNIRELRLSYATQFEVSDYTQILPYCPDLRNYGIKKKRLFLLIGNNS